MPIKGWYTIREASEKLECKQASLLRLIQKQRVKAKKVGWFWMISKEELERAQKEFEGKKNPLLFLEDINSTPNTNVKKINNKIPNSNTEIQEDGNLFTK